MDDTNSEMTAVSKAEINAEFEKSTEDTNSASLSHIPMPVTELQEKQREEDEEDQESQEYPTGFRLAIVILALVLSVFLIALDLTIVGTAIPKITDEFHSLDQIGWYGSAFFLTIATFTSTWGKAYKYFPLKVMFILAIGVFELGSLICGVSQNSTTLIIGRAVAGLGGAGVATGAFILVAFTAPPQKRHID